MTNPTTPSLWRTDDADWRRHRSELWHATKELHLLDVPSNARAAVKKHFLTGAMEPVEGRELWPGHREQLVDWNNQEWKFRRLRMLPSAHDATVLELASHHAQPPDQVGAAVSLMEASQYEGITAGEAWSTPFGMMDGVERDIVALLLPQRFDETAWRAERDGGFSQGRRWMGPREIFDLVGKCGVGFLTHYAANPHHPIQDLVPYWHSAMAHFRFDMPKDPALHGRSAAWRWSSHDDATTSARALCEAVIHFREPRGAPRGDSPALRFRDTLKSALDAGTGCVELDALWRELQERRRLPLANVWDREQHPNRALFGHEHAPSSLRRIVDHLHQVGLVDAFRIEDLRACDVGRTLHEHLLSPLGRPPGEPAPALRYSTPVAPAALVSGEHEVRLRLELLWLLPVPTQALDAGTPRLVLAWSFDWAPGYRFPVQDALSLREAFRLLDEVHGLPLVRVDTLCRPLTYPKAPTIRRVGVERFMAITHGSILHEPALDEEDDYGDAVADATPDPNAWQKFSLDEWLSPWAGPEADAALADFRRAVAEP